MILLFFFSAENPENLPYESLDEFDKLKRNPPFPTDFNDQTDNEIVREKRGNKIGSFSNYLVDDDNINDKLNDGLKRKPNKVPDNSKFHGSNVLSNLENEE